MHRSTGGPEARNAAGDATVQRPEVNAVPARRARNGPPPWPAGFAIWGRPRAPSGPEAGARTPVFPPRDVGKIFRAQTLLATYSPSGLPATPTVPLFGLAQMAGGRANPAQNPRVPRYGPLVRLLGTSTSSHLIALPTVSTVSPYHRITHRIAAAASTVSAPPRTAIHVRLSTDYTTPHDTLGLLWTCLVLSTGSDLISNFYFLRFSDGASTYIGSPVPRCTLLRWCFVGAYRDWPRLTVSVHCISQWLGGARRVTVGLMRDAQPHVTSAFGLGMPSVAAR